MTLGVKNETVVIGEIVTPNDSVSLENSSKNINFLNIFLQDFFAKIVNYGYILCRLFL